MYHSALTFLTWFTNSTSKLFVFSVNYISCFYCMIFFNNVLSHWEPKHILFIVIKILFWDTVELEQSWDKLIHLTDCFIPTMKSWIIMHFGLVFWPLACLCLPWPLTFYYLSHTDTLHLHWSASGLAPLLSPIPAVMTLNTALQGSVPIYNGGFPPLVLLLFASTSSFHSLTSSLLPVCAVDQWSSQG